MEFSETEKKAETDKMETGNRRKKFSYRKRN